jgi:hypothetical protein
VFECDLLGLECEIGVLIGNMTGFHMILAVMSCLKRQSQSVKLYDTDGFLKLFQITCQSAIFILPIFIIILVRVNYHYYVYFDYVIKIIII